MKRALFSLFCLAAAVSAQEPFVRETAQEFTTECELNGQANPDFAIVDRATGAVRLGFATAPGTYTWVTHLTGITQVSAVAAGGLQPGGADAISLTSRQWNRVEFLTATGGRSASDFISLDITAISPGNAGAEVLLMSPVLSATAEIRYLGNFNQATGQLSSYFELPPLRSGNALRMSYSTGPTRLPSFIDEAAHALRLYSVSGVTITAQGVLNSLPPNARIAEFPLWDTTVAAAPHLAVWAPGASTFQVSRITSPTAFTALTSVTAPFPLGSVQHVANIGPNFQTTILLLIAADGSQAATVTLPINLGPLTTRQTFTPVGGKPFTGAHVLASGAMTLLSGMNGRTDGTRHFTWNGSAHTAGVVGTVPPLSGTKATSNVYTFTGEPWVDPTATFTKSFKTQDWTVTASNNGGVLSVGARSDAGPLTGLGSASSPTVSGATAGHFAMPNQVRPDVSIATFGYDVGVPRETLTFQPPPGAYRALSEPGGPSIGFPISISRGPGRPTNDIVYRVNEGAWTLYDPAKPPTLTATGTLEAAGEDASGNIGLTAVGYYEIGNTAPLASAPIIDSNANGLSDAWEKAFNLTNPNADADGDGFTNGQEQAGGSDPRNPADMPTLPPAALPQLNIERGTAPNTARIYWQTAETDLILETSTNLQTGWTSVAPASISVTGNSHSLTVPANAVGGRRFYRLRR
jgi:hypothetical protein